MTVILSALSVLGAFVFTTMLVMLLRGKAIDPALRLPENVDGLLNCRNQIRHQ